MKKYGYEGIYCLQFSIHFSPFTIHSPFTIDPFSRLPELGLTFASPE